MATPIPDPESAPEPNLAAASSTPPSQDRPPVGVNRWIGIGLIVVTYVTATLFVVTGHADVTWWGGFVGTSLPIMLGIVLGGSAIIKTAEALKK